MKLLAVFLLVSSVVIQASGNKTLNWKEGGTNCSSGWTPINNRCFLYVHIPRTWVAAEKKCQSMEANLASIHSSNEYREVQNLITHGNLIAGLSHRSEETWIGGTDGQEWKTWLWSDGSRMRYTNWCPWQPDNFLFTQHCLMMNYSDKKCWDDMWCSSLRPSVCTHKPCLE